MTTFSDRLKEAMYAQNLKQIDLVHIAAENNVKLGKSHVSQYVSGKLFREMISSIFWQIHFT